VVRQHHSLKYPNGDTYNGEWSDNKRNGRGVFIFANGNKYDGEWRDDKKHGRGICTLANGNKYDGEWKDDNAHGQGIFTYFNGDEHQGEYKNGKKNGHGVFTWANGCKHEGEYKDDKRSGHGTYTWSSGEKFVGEFENGRMISGQIDIRSEVFDIVFKERDSANVYAITLTSKLDGFSSPGTLTTDSKTGHLILTHEKVINRYYYSVILFYFVQYCTIRLHPRNNYHTIISFIF
jgi:hypothetical protein